MSVGTQKGAALQLQERGQTFIIGLDRAMAQLGARLHGMQKVASSSLAGSSQQSRDKAFWA